MRIDKKMLTERFMVVLIEFKPALNEKGSSKGYNLQNYEIHTHI